MSSDDLLLETNQLLRRVVEIENERRAEAEKQRVEFEEMQKQTEATRSESFRTMLQDRGLSGEVLDLEGTNFDERFAEAQRKTEENLKAMREQDEMYKNSVLQELQTQSDLLKQIAEKLGA